MPLKLAALSVARSDFGRMEAFYRAVHASPDFELSLAVGAGHHDPRLGHTLGDLEASGLPLGLRLPATSGGPAVQSASVLEGMTCWLSDTRPDALLLLGDRHEMLAAALAATLARVPVIHVGGGHLTLGAMDERIRHAISKLSALHFVASRDCAKRVMALQEAPATVIVTGAPELDALHTMVAMDRNSLCDEVGFDPAQPFLLVTFHPETNVADEVNARFAAQARIALLATPMQVLMTAPCADPGNEAFLQLCEQLGQERAGFRYVPSLGLKRYVAALRHAAAMLGNSSSGIIESATMGLPVVNVGRRQHLRDRAANVLDCAFDAPSMLNAIDQATSAAFVATSRQVRNPYGDGQFVTHALKALAKVKWPLPVDKSWDFARSV